MQYIRGLMGSRKYVPMGVQLRCRSPRLSWARPGPGAKERANHQRARSQDSYEASITHEQKRKNAIENNLETSPGAHRSSSRRRTRQFHPYLCARQGWHNNEPGTAGNAGPGNWETCRACRHPGKSAPSLPCLQAPLYPLVPGLLRYVSCCAHHQAQLRMALHCMQVGPIRAENRDERGERSDDRNRHQAVTCADCPLVNFGVLLYAVVNSVPLRYRSVDSADTMASFPAGIAGHF